MLGSKPHPVVELLEDSSTPVEEVALVIAREANPRLDVAAVRATLDIWAQQVALRRGDNPTPEQDATTLAEFMFGELGFQGNHDDYYDPHNSYLDQVIKAKSGIPITLSVLLMAVGRRAGIVVEGIGFPGHFLVRVGGPNGVYQDPFRGGRILGQEHLRELAARFLGADTALHPSYLEPIGTHTIAVRMLANLKNAYRRRGDYARAMLACDRLVDLTNAPEHRRDRGLFAHALRTYAAATEDLSAYLQARPDAKDASTIQATLLEAEQHAGQALH